MDEIQRSFWIRMPRPVHQVIRKCLRLAIRLCRGCVRVSVLAVFFTIALVGRYRKKRIDVGLGPEPLINNVYHKRALERLGYTAETFVNTVFFITDEFDLRVDEWANKGWWGRIPLGNTLRFYLGCAYLATLQLTRYRCLYIYFHGGELGHLGGIVARCEPFLLRVARVKVVVMPYGGDVHDMSRCPTLSFKHAMSCDYPLHCLRRPDIATRIDRWTRHADHVISGCDWVDYMHHWDTLTLGHFSIDTQQWKPDTSSSTSVNETLRILHAPNHRTIKGSGFFVRAVNELRDEGVDVELVVLEGVHNDEIRHVMQDVDVVADQLIIGWYAMFAIEAMSLEIPVLCHIRDDLENLYIDAGLLTPGELPLVRCTTRDVKDVIRRLATDRELLPDIGRRSRQFVLAHHSLEAVGETLDRINRSMGIHPLRHGGGAT